MSGVPPQANQPERFGVYVGNIDQSVTLDVFRQLFAQCGTIIDCSLNGRPTESHRFGFLDFASEDDRARALRLDGTRVAGRALRVKHSKGTIKRTGADGSGRETPSQQGDAPGANPAFPPAAGAAPPAPAGGFDPRMAAGMNPAMYGGGYDAMGMMPGMPPLDAQRQYMLMMQQQQQAYGANPMMGFPPMAMMGGPAQAPYMGGHPGLDGRGAGRTPRAPVNPPTSEKVRKLREVQRKQFFAVVLKETQRYQRKKEEGKKEGGDAEDKSDAEAEESAKDKAAAPAAAETAAVVRAGSLSNESSSSEEDASAKPSSKKRTKLEDSAAATE